MKSGFDSVYDAGAGLLRFSTGHGLSFRQLLGSVLEFSTVAAGELYQMEKWKLNDEFESFDDC